MTTLTADTYAHHPRVAECSVARERLCGSADWRTATLDVSAFSSLGTPVSITLAFALFTRAKASGVRHALIDNARFGTLWVHAKILEGANADAARVQAEVRQATRILSQAGLNVRLRDIQTIREQGSQLEPDIDWTLSGVPCAEPGQQAGRLTSGERQILKLARGAVSTDINVYYVRTGRRTVAGVPDTVAPLAGYALSPDEYCHDLTETTAGVLMMDLGAARRGVLAHEIGHLLLSPSNSLSSLEHGVADRLNFMVGFNTPALGVVSRRQSANINRRHAPFVSS